MYFFDKTPVGRIINRFSADIEGVDEAIPEHMTEATSMFFLLVSEVIVICIIVPLTLLVLTPISSVNSS